jgi:ribonuclease VapC
MTLDSSALVAVVFREFGHLDLVDRMVGADVLRIGAPTVTETAMLLATRRKSAMTRELALLLRELDVVIVPFSDAHHAAALLAYDRYGRGRHKANLNFGDCLSYAVARLAGDELLFVGEDFAQTDIG